jgi:hypothetical protein
LPEANKALDTHFLFVMMFRNIGACWVSGFENSFKKWSFLSTSTFNGGYSMRSILLFLVIFITAIIIGGALIPGCGGGSDSGSGNNSSNNTTVSANNNTTVIANNNTTVIANCAASWVACTKNVTNCCGYCEVNIAVVNTFRLLAGQSNISGGADGSTKGYCVPGSGN